MKELKLAAGAALELCRCELAQNHRRLASLSIADVMRQRVAEMPTFADSARNALNAGPARELAMSSLLRPREYARWHVPVLTAHALGRDIITADHFQK